MLDQQSLVDAGKAAAGPLASQSSWVHRRVEKISFPSPGEPVYRRHVSVDFSIPSKLVPTEPGVPTEGDRGPARFYVPLSLVQKWPPLLRLDLRDADGRPIPFLTGAQNAILDGAVLVALAEKAAGPDLDDEVRAAIDAVTEDPETAKAGLRDLLPSPVEIQGPVELDATRRKLRADPVFVGAAGALRDSTFLWLRVHGKPGDREIVKFAYDIPWTGEVAPLSAASFGLRPFIAEFGAPHIGSSSSYHLTVTAPAPLKVVDSELSLKRGPAIDEAGPEGGELVGECSAGTLPVRKGDLVMYTEPVGDQGRFYLRGERSGCLGSARVALIADKSLARNGALAAVLIALLVTLYSSRLEAVLELNEAAVTLALVAPALLAYLLVRPAQHEFARSFTTGTRRTLAFSGFMPILGATAIVASGGEQTSFLCGTFEVLAGLAWASAALMLLGAVLPIGKRAKPLSSYKDDPVP